MIETTLWLFFTLWIARIVGNTITFAQVWFVKEYRFDRMWIHLGTLQGRRIYFSSWRRPPISLRSFTLVGITLFGLGIMVVALPGALFWRLLLADVVSFPLTFLVVAILTVPVRMYHRYEIMRATRRLRGAANLFVLAVTGSYGKTSTKEYLAAILSSHKKTLKTQASKNSPVGIAEVLLDQSRLDHEVFIVEMGAYKRGEIGEMTAMVRPQVGIVTAINPQHQDLFGSLENTMAAKYELLAGLTGKNIAIINGDDPRVQEMGSWAKRDGAHVWAFTRTKKVIPGAEKLFSATQIKADLSGVSFVVNVGSESATVRAPVLGKHQVTTILASLAGAVACGMTLADAAAGAARIRPAKKVLEIKKTKEGRVYIDDTFNNNPDAAKAALDLLAMSTGKKVFVMQPMVELGAYANISHEQVGRYAGTICDAILLTNKSWYDYFLKGVRQSSADVPVLVLPPKAAASYIQTATRAGDTVLFKGKESVHVLNALL